MANALYDAGRNAFLTGDIDWVNDDVRIALVDLADYTFSAAHDFLDDVPSGARVASVALGNQTAVAGVADADDAVLSAVTGDVCEALVIYVHTGSDATAKLIAFIDTVASGLPVTPNGGDITIQWSSGSNKIFKL
jgi:hypothetical protein